jgi:hypothetical protein
VIIIKYSAISEHWLTYALVICGILYIAFIIVLTLRKAWKRALDSGYSKDWLWRIVKASVYHALIPALAVLSGFFVLVPMLGIPFSWLRLSIIGNIAYEILSADIALNFAAKTALNATATDFVLVMYVMAIGIMGGMLMSFLLSARIQKGGLRMKMRDRRWGALGISTYMETIVIVFAAPILLSFSPAALSLITAAVLALLLNWLFKKNILRRFSEFGLTVNILCTVTLSVLWDKIWF